MGPSTACRRLRRHLPAVCIVFALAGCGSGSSSSSGSSAATAAAVTIIGTPATAVTVGSVYSFQPTITGATGTIGYSIENMPSWASFSTATGQLLGTPTSANVGVYQKIIITASSGSTSASLPAFSVTVSQAAGASAASNGPGTATLTWSTPTTNTDGTPFTDLAGFYIYYGTSSSTLTNMVDDETGTDPTGSFTVTGLAPGTYYFQVSAYSALGVQSAPSNEVSAAVTS